MFKKHYLVSIMEGQTTHQRHPLEPDGKIAGCLVLIKIRPFLIIPPARIEARLARAPRTVAPLKAEISSVHCLRELNRAIVFEKQTKFQLTNALVEFTDPQITKDSVGRRQKKIQCAGGIFSVGWPNLIGRIVGRFLHAWPRLVAAIFSGFKNVDRCKKKPFLH